MSEIKDKSVQLFLDELASKQATPGGGSAAAVMGAQAAALVSMVCNLTIGKPKYAEVETQMQALLIESEALRETLIAMIKADVDVFDCKPIEIAERNRDHAGKNGRTEVWRTVTVAGGSTAYPGSCKGVGVGH